MLRQVREDACLGEHGEEGEDRQDAEQAHQSSNYVPVHPVFRKIRLIENNAKCRYLKNQPVKGLSGRCFICLRPPPLLWPYTPSPPYKLYSVYVYTLQYTYSHMEGGGGES